MYKFLCVFALYCFATVSYSASFDCSKASSNTEKTICSDVELSALDEKLTDTYRKAIQLNPNLKLNQRDWLKSLSGCENSSNVSDCLKSLYKSRIQVMNFLANPNRGLIGLDIKGLVQNNGRTLLEIGSVHTNSPASDAGIVQGEFIAEINGKTFENLGQVFDSLNVPAGKSLTFKLIRLDNSEAVINLVVAPRPGQELEVKPSEQQESTLSNSEDKNNSQSQEQKTDISSIDTPKQEPILKKEEESGSSMGASLVILALLGIGGFFFLRKRKVVNDSQSDYKVSNKVKIKPEPTSPEQEPNDPIQALYLSGVALYKSGNLNRAMQVFEEAANQDHANSQFYVGKIMMELSKNSNDEYFQNAIAWMRKAANHEQKDAISFLHAVDEIENNSVDQNSPIQISGGISMNTHELLCTDCGWHGFSADANHDEEYDGKICPECNGGDLDVGTFPIDEDLYSTAQCGHCDWMGNENECSHNDDGELVCPSCNAEDDIALNKTPLAGWFGNNRDLILRALTTHGSWLKDVPSSLKGDRELVLTAVKSPYIALKFAPEEFQNDKEIVMAAITKSSSEFEYASENLRDDKQLALVAVTSSGYELRYVSERLKNDKDIVRTAVSESGGSLEHASTALKDDREIVLAAVMNQGAAIEYASKKYKEDEEIVMAAINQDADSIQYVSSKYKKNKSIAMTAVMNSASAFEYLPDNLRADKELALLAISNDGSQYQNLSDDLKSDIELAKLAVKENGWVLEHLDENLRDDKEIVLLAVASSGNAVEFASNRLRADPEVLKIAIENDEDAAQYSLMPDKHSKSWKVTPEEESAALDIYIYTKNDQVITVTRRWREYVVVMKSDRRPLLDTDGYQDIYEFASENNIEIDNLDYHDGDESYEFDGMTIKEEKQWLNFVNENDYVMLENEGWTLSAEKLIFECTISIEETDL